MNAEYSLLTLRPDLDRVDVICIGAVVREDTGVWHVVVPSAVEAKMKCLGAVGGERLARVRENLHSVLVECTSFDEARQVMEKVGGTLSLHDFAGVFSYEGAGGFQSQVSAIAAESVVITKTNDDGERNWIARPVRPHTRARLRRHFEQMGILGRDATDIDAHKVVRNYPVSVQHGLIAEFALRNSAMHVTETVDFEVVEETVRTKTYEAQAKCLVLRAARDSFGKKTQCYVVVSGAGQPHASRAVDLLSTVGRVFSTENHKDMEEYLDRIAVAAGTTRPFRTGFPG